MTFFRTADGRFHARRAVTVLVAVDVLSDWWHRPRALCLCRLVFLGGFWLALCGKTPPTADDSAATLPRGVGAILLLGGTLAGLYFRARL